MKLNKLFAACTLLAAMVLTGCSDEKTDGPANSASEGNVYASLKLSLPVGSRSTTIDPDDNTNSNDGYEIGQEYENTVASVFVVLATQNDSGTFEKVATANSDLKTGGDGEHPVYVLTFQNSELQEVAGKEEEIFVFAYCNASSALQNKIKTETDFAAPTGDVTTSGEIIWGKNAFLMSNRELASIKDGIPADLSDYNTPANPFDLGTVDVQRAAVRFDFKQYQEEGREPNTYPIKHEILDEYMGEVVLEEMALINQSNTYYLLSRTSASANWSDPKLCVRENRNNWVVSTNKELKNQPTLGDQIAAINQAFSFTGRTVENTNIDFNSNDFEWTKISDIANNDDDNHYDKEGNLTWPEDNNIMEGYKIWRYTTENTIPCISATETGAQKRGITTGIIFKGYIKSLGDDDDLSDNNEVLYAFNNLLYGNKDALKAAVDAAPASGLADAFQAAFTDGQMDSNGDLLASYYGFTVYRPTNIGTTAKPVYRHYVYYTYWNRHNDNGNNTQMGQMEFATVRNNVYKLAVTAINQFGHPGDPDDDPDPEDPDDPDESDKVYFKVSVRVMPWVVRINNITL